MGKIHYEINIVNIASENTMKDGWMKGWMDLNLWS